MVSPLLAFLAGIHLIGTVLGVSGITFAEIFYLKATADGRIDEREKEYIRSTFWGLKWGMPIVLITGFLITLLQYQIPDAAQSVLNPSLWAQDTFIIFIIICGWGLAKDHMSWWFGSAVAFSAWWSILALDTWRTLPFSYTSLMALYLLFACATAVILGYFRIVSHNVPASK